MAPRERGATASIIPGASKSQRGRAVKLTDGNRPALADFNAEFPDLQWGRARMKGLEVDRG